MTINGLTWDADTQRFYYTGIDGVVLFVQDSEAATVEGKVPGYGAGVAWSGVTAINESPSGAESNKIYADNREYLNLISKEEFGFTIEAYQSPEAFDECDGQKLFGGMLVHGMPRKSFCLVYRTMKGSDSVEAGGAVAGANKGSGYIYHVVYGCKAAPSSRDNATVNESPEAMTLSWECTTSPISAGLPEGVKEVAHVEIDASALTTNQETALLKLLYGDQASGSTDYAAPTGVPTPLAIATATGYTPSNG